MKVQVTREFLGLTVGDISVVTNREGEELIEIPEGKSVKAQIGRTMWIKFPTKDMSVGICEPFEMHIKEII